MSGFNGAPSGVGDFFWFDNYKHAAPLGLNLDLHALANLSNLLYSLSS